MRSRREGKEPVENNCGDGIRARRRRILKRLAADIEAAHGRGIFRAIEEAAAFRIAEAFDGELHGALGDIKVAAVERRFVGIEQRSRSEDLIVERAFKTRPADAMQKAFRRVPGFGEDAVERFQRELAAIAAWPKRTRPRTRAASRYAEMNIAFQPT